MRKLLALALLALALTGVAFVSRSNDSVPVAMDIGHTRAAVAPAATMDIVPSPVIDAREAFFVGTGDGANGSWTRP